MNSTNYKTKLARALSYAAILIATLTWLPEISNPTFGVDDYEHLVNFPFGTGIQSGRWFLEFIYIIVFNQTLPQGFSLICGISMLTMSGVLISKIINTKSLNEFVIVPCILLLYPALTDMFGFEIAKFYYPLSFLLIVSGYYLSLKRKWIFSLLLITLSLAIYQLSAYFFCVLIMGHLANCILFEEKYNYKTIAITIFIFVISIVVLYPATSIIATKIMNVDFVSDRLALISNLNNFKNIINTFIDCNKIFLNFYFKNTSYISVQIRIVCIIFYISFIFYVFYSNIKLKKYLNILLIFAIVYLMHLCVWATDFILQVPVISNNIRHTYSLSLCLAFIVLFTIKFSTGYLKKIYQSLFLILLILFSIQINNWHAKTTELNKFDEYLTQLIISKGLGAGLDGNRPKIIFIGSLPESSKPKGLHQRGNSIYQSAYQTPWSRYHIFHQFGWYPVEQDISTLPEITKNYYLNQLDAYPKNNFIGLIENNTLIIKFE
jgi:hypothetical protein